MSQYTVIDPYNLLSDSVLDSNKELKPIAGFDIDYTIIKPKSGRKFPVDRGDWKFMFTDNLVIEKLNQINETHQVVFFTNQKKYNQDKHGKFEDILKSLNLPIMVFVSTSSGYYRKPFTGLWDLLVSKFPVSKDDSFYCGDAAGRSGDFAATDRMFSLNIGIPFYTPEEFFLDQKCEDPQSIDITYLKPYLNKAHDEQTRQLDEFLAKYSNSNVLVILVGYPGSGKSRIATLLKTSHNFKVVSRDKLKTKSKCAKLTKFLVDQNHNIVIDATNYSKDMRQESIKQVKDKDYQVVAVQVENDIKTCFYMNQYRCQTTGGISPLVPKVAYYRIRKKLESEPCSTDEGINHIYSFANHLDLETIKYNFETI